MLLSTNIHTCLNYCVWPVHNDCRHAGTASLHTLTQPDTNSHIHIHTENDKETEILTVFDPSTTLPARGYGFTTSGVPVGSSRAQYTTIKRR
jgi:hypothetical protein